MNKRLLAIYAAVFVIIVIMLYLYRQSYNTLEMFGREVQAQTRVVIRLQRLESLLKVWLANNRSTTDNFDLFMPVDVAYDSLIAITNHVQEIAIYQEQRLRMDSIKSNIRAYQRMVETGTSQQAPEVMAIQMKLYSISERALASGYDKLGYRTLRLQESTSVLDKWLFWLLFSASTLIVLATSYSFNFLRLRNRAESFSKTLLENTNNGIISFSPLINERGKNFLITYCNDAALRLLRISDWKNKLLTDIVSDGALRDVTAAFDKVLEKSESTTIEGYLEQNHERIWIQATIAPLEGGILVSMYNVTPVKSYQQRLTYQIKQLELANDELQQYAYITSHDLQEPLRKIQMFSDIGLNSEPTATVRSKDELFRKIASTASHMRLLIQTLLFFTRSTDQPNEFSEVDLNVLFKDVQNELEVPIVEKDARINIGALPRIQGSELHLKLLFSNLISNSLKYSKKDNPPEISVFVRDVSREDYESFDALDLTKMYVCIVVADNGIGFSPELNEKIFTIFQRLHSKDDIPGTGIGLAICRKIAHQHHGYIFAKGEENVGAKFFVYLPLEQPVEKDKGI